MQRSTDWPPNTQQSTFAWRCNLLSSPAHPSYDNQILYVAWMELFYIYPKSICLQIMPINLRRDRRYVKTSTNDIRLEQPSAHGIWKKIVYSWFQELVNTTIIRLKTATSEATATAAELEAERAENAKMVVRLAEMGAENERATLVWLRCNEFNYLW